MATKNFQIPTENIENLVSAIKAINKRAKRLKLHPVAVSFGATFDKEVKKDEKSKARIISFTHVTVEGETPRLNGWSFVAVVESLGEEGTVIRSNGDVALPEKYRTCGNICEHCNKDRRRHQTHIMHNGEEFKAVGSSCLQDFTGVNNPFNAANAAECLFEALGACYSASELDDEFEGGGGRGRHYLVVHRYLWNVAALIRVFGFMSRARAEALSNMSTAEHAYTIYHKLGQSVREAEKAGALPNEDDVETVNAALEWAAGLSNGQCSDFEHSLSVIAKSATIPEKLRGIAACVVSSYLKAQERLKEMEIERLNSSHFGEVGKRMNFEASLVFMKTLDGMYGTTYMHKFITADGNVAVWFGSKDLDLKEGETTKLRATVKKHDERNGVKQTVITRVDVVA